MIVVACNTVSAVAMEPLRRLYPEAHILGVLDAGIRAALAAAPERIVITGTRATVSSDAYRRGIHRQDPSIIVESIACPLLVPMAEEGVTDDSIARAVLDIYLHNVRLNPPDALLLGCTHYPLFRETIRSYLGGQVPIIDSATACADHVQEFLLRNNLSAAKGKGSKCRFFFTDLHSELPAHAARFLGRPLERVEKITLGEE